MDFDPAGLHACRAGHRGLAHRQSVHGRREVPTALLPRVIRDDEQYPVEGQGVADVDRCHQMAGVDGIERLPEDTQALSDEIDSTEPGPGLYPCTDGYDLRFLLDAR